MNKISKTQKASKLDPPSNFERLLRSTEAKKVVLFIFTCLLITLFLTPKTKLTSGSFKAGDISHETIKADASYSIIDDASTKRLQEDAVQLLSPIFDFDSQAIRSAKQKLVRLFDYLDKANLKQADDLEQISVELETSSQLAISAKTLGKLTNIESMKETRDAILPILGEVLNNRYLAVSLDSLPNSSTGRVELRDLKSLGVATNFEIPITQLQPTSRARKILVERIMQATPLDKDIAEELSQISIQPNVFFNSQATEENKRNVFAQVKPVTISLEKGETIVRDGDRINSRQVMLLRGIHRSKDKVNSYAIALSRFLIVFLTILMLYAFAQRFIEHFQPKLRDYALMATTLVVSVAAFSAMIFLAERIALSFPETPASYFYYLIPFAAGSMIIQLVLRPVSVMLFTIVLSTVVALLFDLNLIMGAFTFLSSLFGSLAVSKCQTRTGLFRASFYTAVFSTLTVFILLLHGSSELNISSALNLITITLLSSVTIFCFLSIAMPIVERFDYVTDMRLVELANFNNPLLSRLALEAPGTYHHSRVVAQLVEGAAEIIGANALLAMVSALYHDIGKTKAPQYFVENQTNDTRNIHDKLKPSMSKMIIVSHIKDGVEMAKRAGLPQAIIRGIPEHHGTSLITFFYHKAKNLEDPELDQIDQKEYRYPGPKPGTKETALLLLADSVEAATKSLPDPTPEKIRGVIQKIFNKYFADGQLDECDVTLRDLNLIAKSFHRTLTSVYKPRVEYPEVTASSGGTQKVKKQDAGKNQQSTKNGPNKQNQDQEDDGDDLKRLGLQ